MNRWMKRRIERSRARCVRASGRNERAENKLSKDQQENLLVSQKQSFGLESVPSQS